VHDPACPSLDESLAWSRLTRLPAGVAITRALIEHFGDPIRAIDAGRRQWHRMGLSDAACNALENPDPAILELDAQWLAQAGHRLIPYSAPGFPPQLQGAGACPLVLYCIGDAELLLRPQLAIVGARTATAQGLRDAEDFALHLVQRGLVVTSGLALGIDAAAHRGALRAGGATVAVCGTGLDRVYPARNRQLAHEIAAQGVLVSEFAPGTPPRAEHFPRRNRLISGLSLGVLVVEAARESGSLITARLAAEQGREVFAIPGSIHNPLSRGCHQLIRQGAKLVEQVDDILEEVGDAVGAWLRAQRGAAPAAEPTTPAPDGVATQTSALLEAFGDTAMTLDELLARSGLGIADLHRQLLELELAGQISATADGRYERLR